MKMNEKEKLTVYYDGLCHLCSREIEHYRKMKGAESITFVDITRADFDAVVEGLDPALIHKTMHVRNRDGRIVVGVDGFICIWEALPSVRFLVPIARFYPIHLILTFLYALFTKIRPILPRKSCASSPYCEIKKK